MKACIIQPYYSLDYSKLEECFDGMIKIIDSCDEWLAEQLLLLAEVLF